MKSPLQELSFKLIKEDFKLNGRQRIIFNFFFDKALRFVLIRVVVLTARRKVPVRTLLIYYWNKIIIQGARNKDGGIKNQTLHTKKQNPAIKRKIIFMNQRIFLSTISNYSFKWKNEKIIMLFLNIEKMSCILGGVLSKYILMQPDCAGVSYSFTKHNFHLRVPPFSWWCSEHIPLQLDATCFVHSWTKHSSRLAALPPCPCFLGDVLSTPPCN